jgi:hypothetical protein
MSLTQGYYSRISSHFLGTFGSAIRHTEVYILCVYMFKSKKYGLEIIYGPNKTVVLLLGKCIKDEESIQQVTTYTEQGIRSSRKNMIVTEGKRLHACWNRKWKQIPHGAQYMPCVGIDLHPWIWKCSEPHQMLSCSQSRFLSKKEREIIHDSPYCRAHIIYQKRISTTTLKPSKKSYTNHNTR